MEDLRAAVREHGESERAAAPTCSLRTAAAAAARPRRLLGWPLGADDDRGQARGNRQEIDILREFELPTIPKPSFAATRTLLSVQKPVAAAGLLLNVRQTNNLKEMPGEYE